MPLLPFGGGCNEFRLTSVNRNLLSASWEADGFSGAVGLFGLLQARFVIVGSGTANMGSTLTNTGARFASTVALFAVTVLSICSL